MVVFFVTGLHPWRVKPTIGAGGPPCRERAFRNAEKR